MTPATHRQHERARALWLGPPDELEREALAVTAAHPTLWTPHGAGPSGSY